MTGRRLLPAACAAAAVGLVAQRLARRSGTTDAEVRARLPGDELVPDPLWVSTRDHRRCGAVGGLAVDRPDGLVLGPLLDLGDFVNASVMLRGIKARAELRDGVLALDGGGTGEDGADEVTGRDEFAAARRSIGR